MPDPNLQSLRPLVLDNPELWKLLEHYLQTSLLQALQRLEESAGSPVALEWRGRKRAFEELLCLPIIVRDDATEPPVDTSSPPDDGM